MIRFLSKWKKLYLYTVQRLEEVREEYQKKCTEVLVLKNKIATLEDKVIHLNSTILNTPPPEQRVDVVTRLNRDVYEKFRKGLPNLVVTDTTSPTNAATKLGIAQVLEKLEKELVI